MDEVKFEAGQVWVWMTGNFGGMARVLSRFHDGCWFGFREEDVAESCLFGAEPSPAEFRLIAPAPKPGQRWKSGDVEIQIVDADGRLVAESWENGRVVHGRSTTDVVSVARWLLDNGYQHVDAAQAKPRVEPRDGMRVLLDVGGITGDIRRTSDGKWRGTWSDGAVEEYSDENARSCVESGRWTIVDDNPSAPPVPDSPPWTRADSRRAVDAACERLRGTPFAHAIRAVLVEAVERFPHDIDGVAGIVEACRAWERRRGEVAPGRRELMREQFIKCRETAGSTCALWHTQGDVTSHIYERARSADKPSTLGRPNRGSL